MGFYLHKSVGVGLFRFNLSGSGVGRRSSFADFASAAGRAAITSGWDAAASTTSIRSIRRPLRALRRPLRHACCRRRRRRIERMRRCRKSRR